MSKDLTKDEIKEASLNGTVYDFSVDHSAIDKNYKLNIYEHLIKKE